MPNRLINEQSPYLLQHAHNPVDWYAWGDEAFERAAREHKPLIVSIGYAACHWCHVMEHESFEDDDTAGYMNAHFVCVKVDREEHPDVDHMYMDAVQAIAGNGGWPLNVFVTPERAPFYGGTYYPPRPAYSRPSWMQILQRMNEIWTSQPDEVAAQSEQILSHLRQASLRVRTTAGKTADWDTCRKIADNLLQQGDKEKGGFGNAPKFPATMAISYLLEHYHYTGYEPALRHALLSLNAMIAGGIYDQLGGGFARYSTDRDWLAPHFEKMLYDNALLIMSLCDAFSVTKDLRYKLIVEDTIDFVERELMDKTGGFYCALDADSEGVEGKFYTWTWDEWIAGLSSGGFFDLSFYGAQDDTGGAQDDRDGVQDTSDLVETYFGIRREGNWEGTNILHVAKGIEDIAGEYGINVEEMKEMINRVKGRLMAVRDGRPRPATDDKCLLSWNALMNTAYSRAGVALFATDRDIAMRYLAKAEAHMEWMLDAYEINQELMHVWKDGVAKVSAKLDDYAYLIDAMLRLSSATGNNQWIVKATELTECVNVNFSAENGFYYYTSISQSDIPVRKVDSYDGATPSGNAVMAGNLWICGMCMERNDWIERAERMVQNQGETTTRYSYSYGYWASLLQRHVKGMKTIVCAGGGAEDEKREMESKWLPEGYLLTLQKEISELPIMENKYFAGKMYIFVCSGQACLSPVSSADEALQHFTL